MLQHNRPVSDSQLRWFGLSLASLIFILGLIVYWRFKLGIAAAIGSVLAVLLLAVFYGIPGSRRPIHGGFSACVYPIQLVVSVVLLGIVYFGVITPIGFLLKIRGYDPLRRKKQEHVDSFWIQRRAPKSDDRYFKTY